MFCFFVVGCVILFVVCCVVLLVVVFGLFALLLLSLWLFVSSLLVPFVVPKQQKHFKNSVVVVVGLVCLSFGA